jgi:hypothetical protein
LAQPCCAATVLHSQQHCPCWRHAVQRTYACAQLQQLCNIACCLLSTSDIQLQLPSRSYYAFRTSSHNHTRLLRYMRVVDGQVCQLPGLRRWALALQGCALVAIVPWCRGRALCCLASQKAILLAATAGAARPGCTSRRHGGQLLVIKEILSIT